MTSRPIGAKASWIGSGNRPEAIAGTIILLALIAAPIFLGSRYWVNLLTLCPIYIMFTTSWTFMSGLTGRENFGHALFIGAGAYSVAFVSGSGVPLFFTLPLAVFVSATAGLLIGLPTLRLTGPYFALATLAAATIAERSFILAGDITGGEDGIFGISRLLRDRVAFYYLCLALSAITTVGLWIMAHGKWGRILRAIGSDEAAVQACGIDVVRYKIGAFVISAAVAGLAGGLFAHQQLYVNPHIFAVFLSVTIIIMAYFGGLGSIGGAVISAIALTFMTELLRDLGEYRLMIYTGILVVLLFIAPNGVVRPFWVWLKGKLT